MKVRNLICLFFLFVLLAGCEKEPNISIDLKEDYYPLEVSKTWIYEVDSLKFSPLFIGGKDSVHWELKEEVASVFKDDAGRDVYRIERYLRKNENDSWKPAKVFFAINENNKAELQENNVKFIKLVFPPKEGKTWNGNALISNNDTLEYFQDWEYEYTEVDVPASINGQSFANTLTVLEVDDENLLEKRYSTAQYARGVGLIYREQYNLRIVDSNIPSPTIPWEEKANRGYILRMKIKSYQ